MNDTDWQRIDTAPKDKTEILGCDYDSIEIISWDPFEKTWRNRDSNYYFPSFWQPLPNQPPLPGEDLEEDWEAAFEEWFYEIFEGFASRSEYCLGDCSLLDQSRRHRNIVTWVEAAFAEGYAKGLHNSKLNKNDRNI